MHTMIDPNIVLTNPPIVLDQYMIVNGTCPELPGYMFGTTPFVFDPNAPEGGYPFTTTPLNGMLSLDGDISLIPDPQGIPTVTEWGMIILVLLFLTAGTLVAVRRRRPALA